MGNICRSPSAEGVLRRLVQEAGLQNSIQVDSAGTHNYHIGDAPDGRAQLAARKRGYDISQHRARQVTVEDFTEYDLILAMDWDNLSYMQQICPKPLRHKLMLLMITKKQPCLILITVVWTVSSKCWITLKMPARGFSR